MENLKEKIITVSGVTNLNPTDPKPINFKDENGDKYVLWKTNKTGESVAYKMFKLLPYGGDGATVGVAYTEEPKTFVNNEGKEISFTQRTVVVVKKPSEVRAENQVPNTAPASMSAGYPKTNANKGTKAEWTDDTVFGKCKTLYLVEAFKANLGNPNIKLSEIEAIAEEWARASMRILPTKTTAQSFGLSGVVHTPTATHHPVMEVPTIQQEEINISEIPF